MIELKKGKTYPLNFTQLHELWSNEELDSRNRKNNFILPSFANFIQVSCGYKEGIQCTINHY